MTSPPTPPEDGTVDLTAKPSLAQRCADYRALWQEATTNGTAPPSPEIFLTDVAGSDHEVLRVELANIDLVYRQLYRPPKPAAPPARPTPAPERTMELTPGSLAATGPATTSMVTIGLPPETRVERARKHPPRPVEIVPGESGFTLDYGAGGGGSVGEQEPGPGSPGYIEPTLDVQRAREVNSTAFALAFGTDDEDATGDTHKVPGYEILEILGRGAMGVVYKARQRGLKRIVALKMILAGEHAGAQELGRFRTEAEAVGQLQHPNIVQVFEVGELNGCPYLALEYVDGGSLQGKIAGMPQPVQPAAQLIQVLAQAMDFAHRKGIIHRDLKPANVMLMSARTGGATEVRSLSGAPFAEQAYGVAKIADFGLAKRLEEESGQTRSGAILGTPSYMAPEQAEGHSKEVGPLADQYALGAMLYELLTGRPPFQGATIWETLDMVRTQEPVPPSRLQPRIPRDLETVCLKALQKEAHKRYENCGALAEDLRRFLLGEPILARPVSASERLWRWCRRNPYIAALSGTIAFLLLTVTIGSILFAFRLANEKKQALDARDDARNQRTVAEGQRQIAESRKREADANRLLAEHHADVAKKRLGLALDAFGILVQKVQDQLSDAQNYDLRSTLLKTALDGLKSITDKAQQDHDVDLWLAEAHNRMARLCLQLGQTNDAFQQTLQAKSAIDAVLKANPNDPLQKANAAVALQGMADVCLRMQGRRDLAAQLVRQALQLRQQVLQAPQPIPQHPREDALKGLAGAWDALGDLSFAPTDALSCYTKALSLRVELQKTDKRPGPQFDVYDGLASSYLNLGDAQLQLGHFPRAQQRYEQGLAIWEAIRKNNPKAALAQFRVAYFHEKLGNLALAEAKEREALAEYELAHQTYLELTRRDTREAAFADSVARVVYKLGAIRLRLHQSVQAADLFTESRKQWAARVQQDAANAPAHWSLLRCQARCGGAMAAAREAKQLQGSAPDEVYTLSMAAAVYALCADAAGRAGASRTALVQATVAALRQAMAHGYARLVELETDPDFDGVRSEPAFQKLLADLRHDHPLPVASGR